MSDLNNCTFTGIITDIKEMKELGGSKVISFALEAVKVLPDGKVFKTWPKFEAWGNQADKVDKLSDGANVAVVGEYQVRKDKNEENRYYHTFNVRQIEDISARG